MNALDICCGCGGLSRGLESAGFRVDGVDINPDAVKTHNLNVGVEDEPDRAEVGDITYYHPKQAYPITVGGVPCQPFSIAGSKAALDCNDGNLFRHLLRIAREANSKIVMMENVTGILNRGIETVIENFGMYGYRAEYRVMNAADYGTPQARKRVVIVGVVGDVSFHWPQPTHAGNHISIREALGLVGDYAPKGRVPRWKGHGNDMGQRILDVDKPSVTLRAKSDIDYICKRGEPPRRLTVNEAKVLQGFPKDMIFYGGVTSVMRQIGNAVPWHLAYAMGVQLKKALLLAREGK